MDLDIDLDHRFSRTETHLRPYLDPHRGIFIVVRGTLGVFLDDGSEVPIHANTLRYGESVGDLDVVDGARRTATCIALGEGCLLVQVDMDVSITAAFRYQRD